MSTDVDRDVDMLQAMTETVRTRTIRLLKNATDEELVWAPPGLSNHLLWHAGHAVWLQDLLCIEAVTGHSELPRSWLETFSMSCRPLRQIQQWPARSEVQDRLTNQLSRIIEVVGSLSVDDLHSLPRTASLPQTEPLRYWITHGLQDEANHQGEMYLLLKMQRV